VSIYVGNGTGAFAAPAGFVTPIRPDAKLFVSGDFHSVNGNDPVLDLAYVRPDATIEEYVVTVLLSNGERTFHEVAGPTVRAGPEPLLLAAGRFDGDQKLDLVVVDANPGDSLGRARFRILRGEGEGKFARVSGLPDVVLEADEIPVDIAMGQFKSLDPSKPSDIAIVSKTTNGGGTLRRFINDGSARFTQMEAERFGFMPERVVLSNRFTDAGNYDVVVKRKGYESFVFFENGGDGQIVRRETFLNPPDDDDSSAHFLVGRVNNDDFDDIVMIDEDRTVDVFRNNGSGRFTFKNVTALADLKPTFDPIQATFFLEDFGDGTPGLVGLVRPAGGGTAILAMKGDGNEGLAGARMDALQLKEPPGLDYKLREPETIFSTNNQASGEYTLIGALLDSGFSGQFANAELGNQLPDIGFRTRVERRRTDAEACPSNPGQNPGPDELCTAPDPECIRFIRCPSADCTGPCNPPPPCPDPPCAPRPHQCRAGCKPDCVYVPRDPYCKILRDAVYLIVFRNTCDG
jgi:hypothetical protein